MSSPPPQSDPRPGVPVRAVASPCPPSPPQRSPDRRERTSHRASVRDAAERTVAIQANRAAVERGDCGMADTARPYLKSPPARCHGVVAAAAGNDGGGRVDSS